MSRQNDTKIYCKGVACSVKGTCLRFTKYNNKVDSCIGCYTLIRNCTNQKRYIQDVSKINTDSKRI